MSLLALAIGLGSVVIFTLLCLRAYWLYDMKKRWRVICAAYVLSNREGAEDYVRYTQMKSIKSCLFEIDNWGFGSFIVNKDEVKKVTDYFTKS